ncbi:hypothetical protein F5876DRAFT_82786 [Lentinula aff. lateritia]|uniref:Uncharacterized protein n=1 Tax=Lentinula aff. lateritia TaxID=2804960 RepID=A0ACC1TJ83_9AGAR|nr:hypothetical protein F5876DRAFT_82786 [Lentinula aff. lateritia]
MQLPASYPTWLPHGPDVASSDAEFNGKVLEGRERRRNGEGSDSDSSDSDYRTDESLSESSDESDDSEGPSCHRSLSPPQDRDVDTQSTPLTRSHQISNQQVPMTPTPLTPSISSTPTPSIPDLSGSHFRATVSLRGIKLMCQVADLERNLAITKAGCDAATVYAVCSSQEASIYKHHLNSCTNKKDASKRFPTLACVVTSRDGRIQAKEDDVCRQAKVQADKERARKKKDKERDDIICRAAQEKEGTEFEGSLNSKNKTELQDIAFSLGLDIDATAIVLKIRIDAHFNTTPSLKQDPRYVGLFTRKRKRAPVPSENDGKVGGCFLQYHHQTLDPHHHLMIFCIIVPILHHHAIIHLHRYFILTSRTANSVLLSIISYHHCLPLIRATILSLRPLSLTTIPTFHLLRLYLDLDLYCEIHAQPLTQNPTEPKGYYDRIIVIGGWDYIYHMY